MRIDLIPDVPVEPIDGKIERIVVKEATPGQELGDGFAEVGPEQSHYKQLLQSIYDAVLITDTDGSIIDLNDRACEFLQYSRSELRSLTITDVISGADRTLMGALLENLRNERYALIQAYCLRKDGTYFPSEIAANKIRLGGPHLCFFLRDITLRRQAEEMLRTEHNAIQNAGDGIAVVNDGLVLEYVNPAVLQMWGYDSQKDMLGKSVRDLLSDREEADEMLRLVLERQEIWNGEATALARDGSSFGVRISAARNRNSDGEVAGVVFSFVDISDRIRAESAEREAERHRVMLESLGAACHHLGQPATVLLAHLGVMKDKVAYSDDPTVRELVAMSTKAAEALGEILHRLNQVTEYKTTQYLADTDGEDTSESRILDIRES
jgi:PAS domain S-box-containing protein